MKLSARRIQAAIVMGFSWGAVWGVAGVLFARLPTSDSDLPLPLVFAPLGIAGGVLFSVLLAVVAGGRGFERLSLVRGALLGVASGLLLTAVIVAGAAFRGADLWEEFLVFGPPLAVASAVCAAGSLVVGRRSERRELPERVGTRRTRLPRVHMRRGLGGRDWCGHVPFCSNYNAVGQNHAVANQLRAGLPNLSYATGAHVQLK